MGKTVIEGDGGDRGWRDRGKSGKGMGEREKEVMGKERGVRRVLTTGSI